MKEKKTESSQGGMILALILKLTPFTARTKNLHSNYSHKTIMTPGGPASVTITSDRHYA